MRKIILLVLVGIAINSFAQKPCSPPVVIINPVPTICACNSIIISSNVLSANGPFTFNWQPGGDTLDADIVNPCITTTYTLTVKNSCGDSVKRTAKVTVDNPTMSVCCNATIMPGHDTLLVANGGVSMVRYNWNPSLNVVCLNGLCDSVKVSPTVTTTYTVTGTDSSSCQVEQFVTVAVGPATVSAISGNDFVNIYPNPSPTEFTIDLPTKAQISVCDITGRLLFSKEENAGTITFGKELNPGMYFLLINGKPGVKVVKL